MTFSCKEAQKRGEDSPPPSNAQQIPPQPKREEPRPITEVFDECLEAINTRSRVGMQKCYADKIEFEILDNFNSAKVSDPQGVIEIEEAWRAAFPTLTYEPQVVLVGPRKLAAILLMKGEQKNDFMGIASSGKKLSVFFAQILEFDDSNRIVRERRYFDQGSLLHQLGKAEREGAPIDEAPLAKKVLVTRSPSEGEVGRNNKTLLAAVEHLNTHDAKEVANGFADNASFRYVPEAKLIVGRRAIEKRMAEYISMNQDLTTNIRDHWLAGEWGVLEVITEGRLSAKSRKAAGIRKDGKWTVSFLEISQLDAAGDIKEHWVFTNTIKFEADLGVFDKSVLLGTSAK